MSSVSTAIIRTSEYASSSDGDGLESAEDSLEIAPIIPTDRGMSNVINVVLWLLGSLLVSLNVELNNNLTGILVTVTLYHVTLMILATVLLGKGLRNCNWSLVAPWIFLSLWNLYNQQFCDIVKIYRVLTHSSLGSIPWIAWSIYVLAMCLRLKLTLKVIILVLEQWYSKKLLEELGTG